MISQQNGTFLNDTKITRMAPLKRSKNSNFINHYEMKNFEGDKIMTLCSAEADILKPHAVLSFLYHQLYISRIR